MSTGSNLRRLDRIRRHDGPMTFLFEGEVLEMPDPAAMTFEEVLTCLHIGLVSPDYIGLTLRQVDALTRRWVAHHDLLPYSSAQRLAYVVDRYTDDLIYDLRIHAHMDLVEMWASRRWRTLLATIDRLPSYSLYAEAVSMDEEHAEMLAASIAERKPSDDTEPSGPALRTWTPEVKALVDITDAVRRVEWAVLAVNSGKDAPKPPEPMARPITVMAKALTAAEHKRRLKAHQDLTMRLLPHKRPDYVAEPALPAGWKYDPAGRLRNERGRYAKKPE
jgi:hypothetical protein